MLATVLDYAKDSPLLLAWLVVGGAVLAAVERAFALSGPITKVWEWWQGRELAKLKREAAVRAERRRIEQEEESAVVASLRAEVAWLRAEVARLREQTAPMLATRNQPRVPVPRR